MRRSCAATLLVITALFAASARATAAPTSSTGGNVEPALDTVAPNTVAVVASGAPVQGVVPVIVRNGTGHDVTVRRIRAAAVDGSGHTTARATTGEVKPGFTKEEILRKPKQDPRAEGGMFSRLEELLAALAPG